MYAPLTRGRAMTTVCTCNPGAHWTRPLVVEYRLLVTSVTDSAHPLCGEHRRPFYGRHSSWLAALQPTLDHFVWLSTIFVDCFCSRQPTWLLCHLVDSSARMPRKDVPSCDKPEGAARRRRTQDLRMGIPTAIALRNGERPELKHLSTARKRKRM